MSTWIVSRHPGAVAWLRRHYELEHARVVEHLVPDAIVAGDQVIGTLPVQLIAAVCQRGACYHHLQIPLTLAHRGRELDADELDALGASLECYSARRGATQSIPLRRQTL